MLPVLSHLLKAWTWQMAWRDSRSSRRRLLLFSSSIVLGIAALVAIGSFGRNLRDGIEEQARALLGADLVISSRQVFAPVEEALFQSLGGEQSRQVTLSSMVFFPGNGGTRLVQLRGLEGGFPFYGRFETTPPEAAGQFRRGGGALVEESLLIQYSANVGDTIRLGTNTLPIIGRLNKVPGESVVFATIAPRVYIAQSELERTGLLRSESLAQYRVAFRFPAGTNVTQLVKAIQPQLDENRLAHSTVEKRKEEFGRSLENLYNYLNLAGFVALLLGGVGVASAIHVHVRQKLDTVAVLRCLGCPAGQALAIYLIQGTALGLIGSVAGAALGLGVQKLVPVVMADFLPLQVAFQTSWPAVAEAMATGFVICVLFALLPLLGVRRVSPLAAIRASYEPPSGPRHDLARWLAGAFVAAGVLAFSLAHTQRWQHGVGFAAGLGVAFLLLAAMAKLLVVLVRRGVQPALPYVWRQGLANLHRPNNRTLLLMLAIGLGTFLLLTSYLARGTFIGQVQEARGNGQANTILFDIQADQRESVAALLQTQGLPVLDEAPIVTMRLASIKGRTIEEILADKAKEIPNWVLRREYRSTYHDRLRSGEKLLRGQWHSDAGGDTNVALISIEDGIARDLQVDLGDEIVFDVQGVPVATRVASVREVDWRRVQPNFFVVFPRGVLEAAPAFRVLTTRAEGAGKSAALQRAVVEQFPNVSAIDLTLILQTVDSLLNKISFAVRFMAVFIVVTGLLVMAGAILTGRYQRLRESILLRTLGASRRQVWQILLVEYAALGVLAALTGVLLALGAAWALAAFVFDAPFHPPVSAPLLALALVSAITVVTGLFSSRGVLNHPPLEVLRAEG